MHTVVVACRTIENELIAAMDNTRKRYDIVWIESGLHNVPKMLNARLKEVLRDVHADRVLLAMGFCGNSISGIQAENFELIVPRTDDCISLLLGSTQRRMQVSKELHAYFLTCGWLRGERSLWTEYQYAVNKYGEKRAQMIMGTLYKNYRTLALLDSGAESIEFLLDQTRVIADTFGLVQKVIPATLSYLEDLLTGQWDTPRFIIKSVGDVIRSDDLELPHTNTDRSILQRELS